MTRTKSFLTLVIITTFLVGCKTKKNLIYFQNESKQTTIQEYQTILEPDDFVSIIVTAENTEQAIQFNLPPQAFNEGPNIGYTNGNSSKLGYLIDKEGYINFPVIGKIKIGSLEKSDAVTHIQSKIAEYINNPIVHLQIENFKITVLGEVGNPGTFRIPNDRVTLLEALGLAGDLNLTGVRKNVLVIREVNSQKKEFRVDLTSKEFFNSPVYYLKQNDVVYVEPNMSARSQSTFIRNNSSVFVSIISVIVSTVYSITIISQL